MDNQKSVKKQVRINIDQIIKPDQSPPGKPLRLSVKHLETGFPKADKVSPVGREQFQALDELGDLLNQKSRILYKRRAANSIIKSLSTV